MFWERGTFHRMMKNDALRNRYVSKSIPDFVHECKGDKEGIYLQKTNLGRPVKVKVQAAKHIALHALFSIKTRVRPFLRCLTRS